MTNLNGKTVNERLMDALRESRQALIDVASNEMTTRFRVARLERFVDCLRELTGVTAEQLDAKFNEMFPSEPPAVSDSVPELAGVTLPVAESQESMRELLDRYHSEPLLPPQGGSDDN